MKDLLFDCEKMETDVRIKLHRDDKSIRWMERQTGLTNSHLNQLKKGNNIRIGTFLRWCNFLEANPQDYIFRPKKKQRL